MTRCASVLRARERSFSFRCWAWSPELLQGAASGSLLAKRLMLPNNVVRTLAGCGTAAGIAASLHSSFGHATGRVFEDQTPDRFFHSSVPGRTHAAWGRPQIIPRLQGGVGIVRPPILKRQDTRFLNHPFVNIDRASNGLIFLPTFRSAGNRRQMNHQGCRYGS